MPTVQTTKPQGPKLGFFAIDAGGLGILVLATLGIFFLGWLLGTIGGIAGVGILLGIGVMIEQLGLLGLIAGFTLYGIQPREEGLTRAGFLIAAAVLLSVLVSATAMAGLTGLI